MSVSTEVALMRSGEAFSSIPLSGYSFTPRAAASWLPEPGPLRSYGQLLLLLVMVTEPLVIDCQMESAGWTHRPVLPVM